MNNDLLAAQYASESDYIAQNPPYCIDAQSVFIEDDGCIRRKHTDACFWLAVYAALLHDAYYDALPVELHNMIADSTLSPHKLKQMSYDYNLSTRANDTHQEILCTRLNINIIVHGLHARRIGRRPCAHTINLYEGAGHWVVFVFEADCELAADFARAYTRFGFKFGQYDPGKLIIPATITQKDLDDSIEAELLIWGNRIDPCAYARSYAGDYQKALDLHSQLNC